MRTNHIKLMKFYLLLISLTIHSLTIANTYSAINYTITPIFTSNLPLIKITAEIKGQLSGKIIIDLPHTGLSKELVQDLARRLGLEAKPATLFVDFILKL